MQTFLYQKRDFLNRSEAPKKFRSTTEAFNYRGASNTANIYNDDRFIRSIDLSA